MYRIVNKLHISLVNLKIMLKCVDHKHFLVRRYSIVRNTYSESQKINDIISPFLSQIVEDLKWTYWEIWYKDKFVDFNTTIEQVISYSPVSASNTVHITFIDHLCYLQPKCMTIKHLKNRTCDICTNKYQAISFVPSCLHFLCDDCYRKTDRCPFCKQPRLEMVIYCGL